MTFTSWSYGMLLVVTVAGYWALAPPRRTWWLIGAGLLFYGSRNPPHVLLLVSVTVVTYLASHAAAPEARRHRRHWITGAGIATILAVMGYYRDVGGSAWSGRASAVAPLALSFFALELIHYLVEVGRGMAPGRLRDVGAFTIFFPTLLCGPIKRFPSFAAQLGAALRPTYDDVGAGAWRILVGLVKTLVLIEALGRVVDVVLGAPALFNALELWVGVYAYAGQIYFELSGYSDIAIGSARLLGIRLPENVDAPYGQTNIVGFWRRWHMSLTQWFDDYVARPLRGKRPGVARGVLCGVVTMVLLGVWHGAGVRFAVWGCYHAAGVSLFHLYRVVWPTRRFGRPGRALAIAATAQFVCLGWVLYRFEPLEALELIGRLVGVA